MNNNLSPLKRILFIKVATGLWNSRKIHLYLSYATIQSIANKIIILYNKGQAKN